jgi:peptidoglycan/xylan/chitin deacetylase (PgdA/CDA1 family)
MILWLIGGLFCWLIWFSYRYAWWRPAVNYRWPRILMYHMIKDPERGARFNGLRVSPLMFERQLSWLKKNGWSSYTMSEIIESSEKTAEKKVVLTFDDGFADNYTNAFPLLKKYNFKATLYLVADRHDRDWSVSKKQHHNTGELRNEPKLSDEQVAEMLTSGLVELGAHTLTHANFAIIATEEKKQQILQSKIDMEKQFGVQIKTFAYPFGIFLGTDPQLVANAGYTSAVTTESGIDPSESADLFQLKRIKMSGKDNFLAFVLRMRGGKRGWVK